MLSLQNQLQYILLSAVLRFTSTRDRLPNMKCRRAVTESYLDAAVNGKFLQSSFFKRHSPFWKMKVWGYTFRWFEI